MAPLDQHLEGHPAVQGSPSDNHLRPLAALERQAQGDTAMTESSEYGCRDVPNQETGRPPTHRVIPDPREVPVLSVVEAGRLLRMGRSKAYVQARRFIDTKGQEGIPTLEFGHRLVCPTAKILELVGLVQG